MDIIYNESNKDILNNLLQTNSVLQDDNLIKLFAFYISSNPDFKYNISYLTDSIKPFNNARNKLKFRYYSFKIIAGKLAQQTPENINGILIFDDLFIFKIEKSLIKDEIDYFNIDQYRFDSIPKNKYIVKFIIGDMYNPQKSKTYKLSFETNDEDEDIEELKSEVGKKWQNFINTLK